MNSFASEVDRLLTERRFRFGIVEIDQRPEAGFGNALVVIELEGLRVRIVRDRGLISFDLGASSGWWGGLQDVLAVLGIPSPPAGPMALPEGLDLLGRL